jgi:DNA-binding NarL/FixJ family response regulator
MIEVFIISNHLMFGRGLESLLRQEAKLVIVGQETGINEAVEQLKELQPDVVILDSDDPPANLTPQLMNVLRASPGVKVIGLSLQTNNLYTYQAKQWIVKGVADLMEAIEDDLPASESAGHKGRQSDLGNKLSVSTE